MEEENTPLVRSVGVIDENLNFVPYGSTAIAKGVPVFIFDTKEEYDQHAPTLPEPCVVITLDDIDTGGFEFDSAIDPESENAVQNKVIAAALEALRDKATFDRLGMVRFTDATTVTDQNSGYALSAIEKNASVEGSLANSLLKSVTLNYGSSIDLKNETYCNAGWKEFVADSNGVISFFGTTESQDIGTARFVQNNVQVARQDFSNLSPAGIVFPINKGAINLYIANLSLGSESVFKFIPLGG